jgi:hypothetical protein
MASEVYITLVSALAAAIIDMLDGVGDISKCERSGSESVGRRIAIRNFDYETCIPIRRLRVANECIVCGEPTVVSISPPNQVGNMMDARATTAAASTQKGPAPDGEGDAAGR